jgi:1-acyl-sn-glycerol-3-phosphate acyltransferase
MILFLRRLHNYYYIFTAVVALVLFYPFLYFFSLKQSRFKNMNRVRRIAALLSATASGIFFRVKYEEVINWSKTYVVCPNHTSNIDILSMSIAVKNDFSFISKAELLSNPLFSVFLKSMDIPVDRNSRMSSFRAFKKAEEYLKDGRSMVIFPEGKIGDDYPPILHEFKNGPFRLAIQLGIPIIPITSLDTWNVLWDSGFERGTRPGICDIYVHKPIETKHLSLDDADMLKDTVYNLINTKFASA